MSYIFWGIAAAVFTLPVIWICYSEGVVWAKALILGVAGGFVLAWMRYTVYGHDLMRVLKELFAYIWLIPVAQIDRRTRRIPNRWILYGVIGSILFLIAEKLAGETGGAWMGSGVTGALLGGGFFFLASLISDGGIGMGDAKMYMILGLLIGGERIFILILITLVFALVHGFFLIVRKKGNHRIQIPLGPFAYMAMMALLLMDK